MSTDAKAIQRPNTVTTLGTQATFLSSSCPNTTSTRHMPKASRIAITITTIRRKTSTMAEGDRRQGGRGEGSGGGDWRPRK
jgi:hypothetical protein